MSKVYSFSLLLVDGHISHLRTVNNEVIVDQMELDDAEYRTFVGGRDGRLFENESTIPED